ncbi:MAG TPA: Do family serine endopeptidase [bacterium]|nr:Do family serine endopeptidase [bacterium]HQL62139.1 Do family serine endopeptidase [bacterium]
MKASQSPLTMGRLLRVTAIVAVTSLFCVSISDMAGARSAQALKEMSQAFSNAAKKVTPSVVHIRTLKTVTPTESFSFEDFPPDSPFAPFFEHFLNPRDRGDNREDRRKQDSEPGEVPYGMGSGLVVTPDGYILTNNHVVDEADKIEVRLRVGGHDKTYTVDMKNNPPRQDPVSDLAVIKIDAKDLPVPELGDSDQLEVGEWVIAIGNPFGLDQSVTAGIVSYLGRGPMGGPQFGDFIQTDAAINPGNSGGPLVDLDGKVVGINAAIATGSPFERSYAGIAFTIPINIAKSVKDALIEKGSVTRGYLGVGITAVGEEVAKHENLENQDGALVNSVQDGTPAKEAGIQVGDIVIELNGEKIKGPSELQLKIAAITPGEKATLTILRHDGDSYKEKKIQVTIGTRPSNEEVAEVSAPLTSKNLGMTVQDLTESTAQSLGYTMGTGVLVTDVAPYSPAANAGIQQYDLIRQVNHQPVKTVAEFKEALAKREDSALLVVQRQKTKDTFITVIEMK